MVDVTTNVEAADLLKLDRAISLMVTQTSRTAEQATMRGSIAFLVSARAASPRAKGKNRRQRTIGGKKYYIVHNQSARPPIRVLIPNANKGTKAQREANKKQREEVQARFKAKPRVGAARASWGRAFSDLNKPAGQAAAGLNRARRLSRSRKTGGRISPAVNITNDMSYILTVAPNLEEIALAKAGRKLLDVVERGIEKQTRSWK